MKRMNQIYYITLILYCIDSLVIFEVPLLCTTCILYTLERHVQYIFAHCHSLQILPFKGMHIPFVVKLTLRSNVHYLTRVQ